MTERNGAAVDIDDVVRDAEVGHRRNGDRSKGLVELEEVDIGERQSGPLERDHRGPAGLGQQGGVGASDLAVADDLGERFHAEGLGLRLRGDDGGGASIGDLRGVAGGDIAGAAERPTQTAEGLGGGADPDAFVVGDDQVVALALLDGDGDDLFGQQAVLLRDRGALVRHR